MRQLELQPGDEVLVRAARIDTSASISYHQAQSQEGAVTNYRAYLEEHAEEIQRLRSGDPECDITLLNNSPNLSKLITDLRRFQVDPQVLHEQGIRVFLGKGTVATRREALDLTTRTLNFMSSVARGVPRPV